MVHGLNDGYIIEDRNSSHKNLMVVNKKNMDTILCQYWKRIQNNNTNK